MSKKFLEKLEGLPGLLSILTLLDVLADQGKLVLQIKMMHKRHLRSMTVQKWTVDQCILRWLVVLLLKQPSKRRWS